MHSSVNSSSRKNLATEARTAAKPAANLAQTQSAQIWREFRKRKLAVFAALLMLLEILIAVFAPFIANDRPLAFRGFNRFEFQALIRAADSLVILSKSNQAEGKPVEDLRKLLRSADENLAAAHREIDGSTEVGGAFQRQITTARELLVKVLADLAATKEKPVAQAAIGNSPLVQLQKQLKTMRAGKLPPLVFRWYFPVLSQLNWMDLWFMSAALIWPLWWAATRVIKGLGRLPVWGHLLILASLPGLCSVAWELAVPDRLDQTKYKQGVLAAFDDNGAAPVVFEIVAWPLIPFGIDEYDTKNLTQPPAASLAKAWQPNSPWDQPHWLGTNHLGADLLTLLIWGARISLSVGLVAVLIYMSIGIVLGALAGFFRGWVDIAISRLIEVVICFPTLFLVLTIVALIGPSLVNIMVVIGLTSWTGVARLVRSEFLRLVDQEFVLASRALGFSPSRIIFRHILPNALAPVVVAGTFGIAGAILLESSLSFLGLGVRVPTPSWGTILSDGRSKLFQAPWQMTYPGFAIFITVTCYNLIGEALRDAADPRLRGTR